MVLMRLAITRLCLLGDRLLEPGDTLILDTEQQTLVVGARLSCNTGAVLGLLAEGSADPIDISPASAFETLRGTSPPYPPRVLPFRPRRTEAAGA